MRIPSSTAAALLTLGWLVSSTLLAAAFDLTSPDGRIKVQFTTNASGDLIYAVSSDGKPRLEPARAGLTVAGRDLGTGVELGEPVLRRISETFPWRGNKILATNHCVAAEIPIRSKAGGPAWALEVRVFDDGVGFRYRLPGSGTRQVQGEATAWQLPADSTLWLQTDTANYEGNFHAVRADAVPLETKAGDKMRPTHIGPPMTVVYADGTFGLISEASLFNYSGMTLRPEGQAKFRATFEDDPQGWAHDGPVVSPWRVIVLTRDLDALVNSDVIPALCDPPDPRLFPDGINTAWLRPGKAPCTWMVFGNDGAQWDKQKWFVDVSAATGCEYLLVDAGWRSERWGWLKNGGDVWARAAELVRYGAERGVGIVLWHAYPEGRDDSPGLTTVAARDELFRKCQEAGVKGVKVDFFDTESKAVIEAQEDLSRRAARHQLMINYHGVHKPTGEARTWPNEITREGIREQEYVLWDTLPLEHYGSLPFTRMVVGHADFLPGYLQEQRLKNTTRVFQMASVIIFNSPFLCWPDNPEAYLNSPWLHFVRTVPVVWDETRVLPGSVIGDTVIFARRKGDEWYVAALNCRPESRTLVLDLTSLGSVGEELTVYHDRGSKTGVEIRSGPRAPEAAGKLSATLPAGGGFIAHFRPPRKYPAWN